VDPAKDMPTILSHAIMANALLQLTQNAILRPGHPTAKHAAPMTLTSLVVWERVIVTQMMSALVTWCVEQIIAFEWAVDSRKDQIVVSFLQSKDLVTLTVIPLIFHPGWSMEKNKTLFSKNAAVKKSRVVMDKVTVTWTLNVKGI
jgi:hypothetical protein